MAQNQANGGFAILLVFVLTIAGGVAAGIVGSPYENGLLLGFLIGIAVLLTIEYASTRIRRT
jgi:hypothetical protein